MNTFSFYHSAQQCNHICILALIYFENLYETLINYDKQIQLEF